MLQQLVPRQELVLKKGEAVRMTPPDRLAKATTRPALFTAVINPRRSKMRLVTVVAVGMLVSACSSTPVSPVAEAPTTKAATPAVPTPVIAPETEAQKLERIIKTLAANSIYFDYDDYTIKPQYQGLLRQDYDFLKSSPKTTLTLTGNADERGSSEYNLALGQKRAEAVARALRLLGVPETQMEAVSFGKEKPRATCHEEKCWRENRRVDFSFKSSSGPR